MKKFINHISAGICLVALQMAFTGCADTDGDGEGEYLWEGSRNPENTSYRNPVWEPSLAAGTVFKAASAYNAISPETQWAAGVDFCCPSLLSSNLMNWTYNQQTAFTLPSATGEVDETTGEPIINPGTRPQWITGTINALSADFARTISGANYWMVYSTDADNAFGAASSNSGLGPYTDQGCFLTAEAVGAATLRDPFFAVVASTNYYVGYTTESGSYLQQVNVRRNTTPTLKGTAYKVAGPQFTDIALLRLSASDIYLFGTVATADGGSEVRYARATSINGPFCDRNGVELTDGASNGELLITAGTEYVNPRNVMRVFQNEAGDAFYVAYNAANAGNAVMASGYSRQPLFVSPVAMDEDGWFADVITPAIGWTSPRFD